MHYCKIGSYSLGLGYMTYASVELQIKLDNHEIETCLVSDIWLCTLEETYLSNNKDKGCK